MPNNPPPLKRQKYDNVITVEKCLYCSQQQNPGICPHQAPNSQFLTEYKQLQAATEDSALDLEDIGRRLKKLETRLTLSLQEENTPTVIDRSVKNPTLAPDHDQHSKINLTPTGISITTHLTDPQHFIKLLVSGINPTLVQQKANKVFSRGIDIVGPAYDNPNNAQGISNLSIDNEDPEELAWFDLVLATSYPTCFLVYQMVEKDRLVEWVSPAFIEGLKGQVKLEHSLLAKSVRAFVYNHEKMSAQHCHSTVRRRSTNDHSTFMDPPPRPLRQNINLNRGAFFFEQAQELLELCYMNSSRNVIRALLHMYMYQVMTPYGHLKAVQYSDLAIRMAQVLKLNTEKGMLVNEQIREDDRRLWWSTLWVHLSSCISFHRPMMVSASEIMTTGGRFPSKRQDESIKVGHCIDFCVNSVKLLLMSISIGERLCAKTTEARLLWEVKEIEHQLDTWSLALPEALQPRFWAHLRNNQGLDDTVDEHTQSARAFAVEIGLLLQGQWAMNKMQVYECFSTNDSSVLDLLMVRNRLHVALNYTNYLAQSLEQARPCLIMYLLTLTEPSLNTLIDLVSYENSVDVVGQAVQQLSMLKVLFQADPFSNDTTARTWVQVIDQIVSKQPNTQLTYIQPFTTTVNNVLVNSAPPTPGVNAMNTPISIQNHHQTYTHQPTTNTCAIVNTTHASSIDTSLHLLEPQLKEPYQQHESTLPMMDRLGPSPNQHYQHHYYTSSSTYLHNGTSQQMDTMERPPSLGHQLTRIPSSTNDMEHQKNFDMRSQAPMSSFGALPPHSLQQLSDRSTKAAGKQPSWSSLEVYPDHPPPTNQQERHY